MVKSKKLTVTTASGQVLFSTDFDGKAVGIGWTFAESLIIVLEDGNVLIFNLMGEQTCFQLKSFGRIIQAKIYSTGLVALTDSYDFIAVSDFSEPRPKLLKSAGLNCEPESWIVVPPHLSGSKHVEVMMSSFDTLVLLDSSFVLDQKIDGVPFKKMALSPNGSLIALFSESGTLYVYTIDFQKCLAQIPTNKTLMPLEMEWCGNDSVVLHWDKILWVVGPSGEWISYTTNGRVHVMSESDGIRIINGGYAEFLQKVPNATEAIFRIGSTSPGAVLFDAAELYESRNPKAEECIRSLSHDLEKAVDTCIQAAADEHDRDTQKKLMRAASFGKCFLNYYSADKFVQKCRIIRVLNAIRDPEIGLYLTHAELGNISYQMIIKRLVNRNLHVLAFKIAKYLGIEFHGVLVHWACFKIKASIEDDLILSQKIVQKFLNSGLKIFSLSEVAKTAYDSGRRSLAIKLLEHEPRAADRVPLLLSMQEEELALNKAIESGDTDLIYFAIFHMKRKLPLAEFFRILNNKPIAASLLEVYGRHNDLNLLRDFYYQDDRRADGAKLMLLEGLASSDAGIYMEKLKIATRMFSDDKRHTFEAKMTDEQVKLLGAQLSLEKDLGQTFVGLCVNDTISKLLLIGNTSKAAKIKSDFKVSEKCFCWLRLKVFVQTQNWDGLEKFVKTTPRFSIISVIETLIRAGHKSQAELYLKSVKSTTNAVDRAAISDLLARISLK